MQRNCGRLIAAALAENILLPMDGEPSDCVQIFHGLGQRRALFPRQSFGSYVFGL